MSDSKAFTASKGWSHRFRNRFGLRNIKITGEAVSADEEAAATFMIEFKEVIRVWYYPWFQASTGGLRAYPLWTRRTTIGRKNGTACTGGEIDLS